MKRLQAGVRRWLRRQLPPGGSGTAMVTELDREYQDRPAGSGRDLWYLSEAIRLGLHYRFNGGGHDLNVGGRMRGGGEGMMSEWMRSFRHGLRRVRRDPGLAVVGAGTMALGIGATVSIFTVVNTVLLEPLPYANPERLVAIFEADLGRGVDRNVANAGNARAWQEQAESLEEVAGIVFAQPVVLETEGSPEEVQASHITPNFFSVLGVTPALGRPMSPDAGGSTGAEVLLTDGFWQREFGGDPEVLGRTLTVNGSSYEVVGVLPPAFVVFGDEAEFFRSVPLDGMGDQTTSGRYLWVVGRLAEGRTVAQLRAEMDGVSRNLQEAFPDFNAGWTTRVVPLQDDVVGEVAGGLWALLGAVGVLLIIACTNVASVLLARATERRQEMAVRTSLGATGRGLLRQMMAESLVLSLAGGVLGTVLAAVVTPLLARRIPGAFSLPRVAEAGLDVRVLLFSMGVTLITGLVFGLIPAWEATRSSPARTLNQEARGSSRFAGGVRSVLVVTEVALSVVLLSGAGLLTRSFLTLMAEDSGLEPTRVVSARVNLSGDRYPTRPDRARFMEELVTAVQAEPGALAAGAITGLPMDGFGAGTSFIDFDAPEPPRDQWPVANIRNVQGDYFAAMGIDLLAGRSFDQRDRAGSPQVVVVNEALASELWPGEEAVGKRVGINWGPLEEPWEVVGVVGDVRLDGPAVAARPTIYHLYGQAPYFPFMHLVVRTQGDPLAFGPSFRRIVTALDPDVPLSQPRIMTEVVDAAVARPRMTTFLMGLFAGASALLAAVGLYGVLSYTVSRRVREIGLRMAVGADRSSVLRLVMGQGMRLVALGVLLGILTSLGVGRLMAGLLYGVRPTDPASLSLAAGGLVVVALLACLVPAWRATRVEPAVALREG